MLRFTKSRDGAVRATVRVDFRVELPTVAYALAIELICSNLDAEGMAEAAARYGKADIERMVRTHFYVSGPPEQWQENEGDDWDAALAAAEARVEELWS